VHRNVYRIDYTTGETALLLSQNGFVQSNVLDPISSPSNGVHKAAVTTRAESLNVLVGRGPFDVAI
jgi:hypothetical protein